MANFTITSRFSSSDTLISHPSSVNDNKNYANHTFPNIIYIKVNIVSNLHTHHHSSDKKRKNAISLMYVHVVNFQNDK